MRASALFALITSWRVASSSPSAKLPMAEVAGAPDSRIKRSMRGYAESGNPFCFGLRCGVVNCFTDEDCYPDQICSTSALGASFVRSEGITAATMGASRFSTFYRRPLVFPSAANVFPLVAGVVSAMNEGALNGSVTPDTILVGSGFCVSIKKYLGSPATPSYGALGQDPAAAQVLAVPHPRRPAGWNFDKPAPDKQKKPIQKQDRDPVVDKQELLLAIQDYVAHIDGQGLAQAANQSTDRRPSACPETSRAAPSFQTVGLNGRIQVFEQKSTEGTPHWEIRQLRAIDERRGQRSKCSGPNGVSKAEILRRLLKAAPYSQNTKEHGRKPLNPLCNNELPAPVEKKTKFETITHRYEPSAGWGEKETSVFTREGGLADVTLDAPAYSQAGGARAPATHAAPQAAIEASDPVATAPATFSENDFIEGYGARLFNIINSGIGSLQISCLNPVKRAGIGQRFKIGLSDQLQSIPNIIRNELFQITFLTNGPVNNPFIFVHELTGLQNIGAEITVECQKIGRFPLFFLITVFYGLELRGGKMVCMAEAVCDNAWPEAPPIPRLELPNPVSREFADESYFEYRSPSLGLDTRYADLRFDEPNSAEMQTDFEYELHNLLNENNRQLLFPAYSHAARDDGSRRRNHTHAAPGPKKTSGRKSDDESINQSRNSTPAGAPALPATPALQPGSNEAKPQKATKPPQKVTVTCHSKEMVAMDLVGRHITLNLSEMNNDVFKVSTNSIFDNTSVKALIYKNAKLESFAVLDHYCASVGREEVVVIGIATIEETGELDAAACPVILDCGPEIRKFAI